MKLQHEPKNESRENEDGSAFTHFLDYSSQFVKHLVSIL